MLLGLSSDLLRLDRLFIVSYSHCGRWWTLASFWPNWWRADLPAGRHWSAGIWWQWRWLLFSAQWWPTCHRIWMVVVGVCLIRRILRQGCSIWGPRLGSGSCWPGEAVPWRKGSLVQSTLGRNWRFMGCPYWMPTSSLRFRTSRHRSRISWLSQHSSPLLLDTVSLCKYTGYHWECSWVFPVRHQYLPVGFVWRRDWWTQWWLCIHRSKCGYTWCITYRWVYGRHGIYRDHCILCKMIAGWRLRLIRWWH